VKRRSRFFGGTHSFGGKPVKSTHGSPARLPRIDVRLDRERHSMYLRIVSFGPRGHEVLALVFRGSVNHVETLPEQVCVFQWRCRDAAFRRISERAETLPAYAIQ
jgi:hypothetical protein